MAEPDVKRLPISEFRVGGYLHEVNRLVLHPLGLALEVGLAAERGRAVTLTEEAVQNLLGLLDGGVEHDLIKEGDRTMLRAQLDRAVRYEAGEEFLAGIWDCRDDPEGIAYGEDLLSPDKAERVCAELLKRREERKKHTGGWVIQPIPDRQVLSTTYTDPELRTSGGEPVVEPGKFAGVEMPEGELPECCEWCGNQIAAGEAEYDDAGTPYCGHCWDTR